MNRIPITSIVYLIPKNQFIYLPTRTRWVRGGVDVAVGEVDGMRGSEWVKRYRAVSELPKKEEPT